MNLVLGEGRCFAYVRQRGARRELLWSFNAPVRGLVRDGAEEQASVEVDGLRIARRDWRELSGTVVTDDDEGIEASIYAGAEHHLARSCQLSILDSEGVWLRARVELRAELDALDGLEVMVSGEALFRFEGATMIRDDLFPKPSSLDEARQVMGTFADLESFAGCRRTKRGDFVFVPDIASLEVDEPDD